MLVALSLVACNSNFSSTEATRPADAVTPVPGNAVAVKPTSLPSIKPVHPSATPYPTSIPLIEGPVAASFVAVSPDGNFVAAINPDSGSVTLVDAANLTIKAEIFVGEDPRTLCFTPDSKKIVVSNWGSSSISVISLDRDMDVDHHLVGLMPYAVVTDGNDAYVTEFATGNVSVLNLKTGKQVNRISVNPFPAGLALTSDRKQLLVTHLFNGEVTSINVKTAKVSQVVSTGLDISSNQFIAIGPLGEKAYLPQTRANVENTALLFDSTVFPVVNILDLSDLTLMVRDRITIDTADEPVNMPFSVAISADGNIVFIANAGSDDVSVIDQRTGRSVAHINVGANPRGIAITPDGSRVFVNNVLDGTLSVIDTDDLVVTRSIELTDIPLPETILEGKKIFNSASEPLLTTDNWISCATCHFDGMMDGRTWLGFPDGPRNTPSLFGVSRTLPIHWSGDLDELQDVEVTIREIQVGNGLINGEAHDTLGLAHAGMSSQLDALASYLAILEFPISPQLVDGIDLNLGRQMFTSLECGRCHVPPIFTDRELHEVGTGDRLLEKNRHGHGTSFDTPTLIGVWMTAPYFHDGRAQTLEDVFRTGTVHNVFEQLSVDELGLLIDYLKALSLDD